MPANRVRPAIAALALVAGVNGLAMCGCGRSAPRGTVGATGTVTLNGAPLAGANVTFVPASTDESILASQAATDEAGRFQLTTHVGGGRFQPGIKPGRYRVTIVKLDTAGVSNILGPPKNLVPQKYADVKTSNISADVVAEHPNDFEFKMIAE